MHAIKSCCCETLPSRGRRGERNRGSAGSGGRSASDARSRIEWAVRAVPFYGPAPRRVLRGALGQPRTAWITRNSLWAVARMARL